MSIIPKKIWMNWKNHWLVSEELKKWTWEGLGTKIKIMLKNPSLGRYKTVSPMCDTAQTLRTFSIKFFINLHNDVF